MTEREERELIELCIEDNRNAQEKLYRLHADKMFSVCLYYAENRDEACDFLQEGFLMVFRKLEKFNFQGSFEGWIRRVIVNTALGHLRKKKRYREIIDEYEVNEASLVDLDVEIDSVPFQKVISLVNELPAKCSIVLKLFAIEGYTHPEIAEIMDISVGTSKSQLNRARTLLKESSIYMGASESLPAAFTSFL